MTSFIIEMPIMAGDRKGDILAMPCGPSSTFGDVRAFLANKLQRQDFSIHLQDRGVQYLKSEGFASKTLRELLSCASSIPVFFEQPKNGFRVTVKTCTGKSIPVFVHETQCVIDIKECISRREGIPGDQQRFIFAGEQLEDGCSIRKYGITKGHELHLVLRLRGGGHGPKLPMIDVSNDSARIDRAWSDSAPSWRGAKKGFCLEGTCDNMECKAYQHDVICNMGFGSFNMHMVTPKCPMCYCVVESDNMGFNNCFYRIRGVKEESNQVISIPWSKVEDCYRTWDDNEADVIEWEYMEIVVRELEAAKLVPGSSGREAPVLEECAICFNQLRAYQDVHMLKCGHSYHEGCWKDWSDISRSKSNEVACPLCRTIVWEA